MPEITIEEVGVAVLVDAARAAARHAHAPYSRFAVGAAILLADGAIVTGANFENASYGLSLCAETVALASANAAGRLRDAVAMAVTGGAIGADGPHGDAIVTPCGRCRQILAEATRIGGRDLPVFCASPDGGRVVRHLVSTLLPHAFGPDALAI